MDYYIFFFVYFRNKTPEFIDNIYVYDEIKVFLSYWSCISIGYFIMFVVNPTIIESRMVAGLCKYMIWQMGFNGFL